MIEKRNGKRFQVDWPVKVEAKEGDEFSEEGVLQNISSGGALFLLSKPLAAGTRLDVSIRLPSKKNKWMKYSARVLRVEGDGAGFAAAVKFDGAKPRFGL
ncbi:MAG TPA: PilZ domain-containing protein [Blastocatellia bacterium]|nr:PilZ domain-containing protein [Blastocatellia bacterium]